MNQEIDDGLFTRTTRIAAEKATQRVSEALNKGDKSAADQARLDAVRAIRDHMAAKLDEEATDQSQSTSR